MVAFNETLDCLGEPPLQSWPSLARVSFQSIRAILMGSMPSAFHQSPLIADAMRCPVVGAAERDDELIARLNCR